MDSPPVDFRVLRRDVPEHASAANGSPVESANLRAIKRAFTAFMESGTGAGVDALLRVAHDDCVFRPYSAGGRELCGHNEVRAYFRDAAAAGTSIRVTARSFEERGDEVIVSGSTRVGRPGGGFAESQICWIYRFRDGLVEEASWGPRHSA